MTERSKIHVGLDVHKDSISVAAAEPDRVPGRLIGKVPHDVHKLLKVLAKVGTAEQLHIVYEAERVNEFATPGFMNLLCKAVVMLGRRSPMVVG
jgi:hypothetical protein